jgi:arabinan endo-1,5-alpha-L-arabinosidase
MGRHAEVGVRKPHRALQNERGLCTIWLRLTHGIDRRTEHELGARTSRDGRMSITGGTRTLPAGSDVKVGLVSHGGAGATARFAYFRVYR